MFDKLSIINTSLIRTSNNQCNFEGDGSDEWTVASNAYETEVANLLAEHDWRFASTTQLLQRVGASEDPRFTDVYAKPVGCLHLEALWINGASIVYDILDGQVHCNATASGASPTAKFIPTPTNDKWPPLFIEALRQRVMSHIYRGLNEDIGSADSLYRASEMTLEKARTRSDQEVPARAMVVSRLARARTRRRGGGGFIGSGT